MSYGLPNSRYHPKIRASLSKPADKKIARCILDFNEAAAKLGVTVTYEMSKRLRMELQDLYNYFGRQIPEDWKFVDMYAGNFVKLKRGSMYLHVYLDYQVPESEVRRYKNRANQNYRSRKTRVNAGGTHFMTEGHAFRVKPGGGTSGTDYGYVEVDEKGNWISNE